MKLTFLGTGSSGGTPVIGCDCPVCQSPDPRNKRTRCSSYLEVDGVRILIDTAPDLRTQALRENIRQVDAVLYTHIHADHLNGIDDLRPFCARQQQAIPLYGDAFTMQDIQQRFAYAVQPPTGNWERPVLSLNPVTAPFSVQGVRITPIPIIHGRWPIYGYRVGDFAYITDISDMPETSLPLLQGLNGLAISALRYKPHHTHFCIAQSLDLIAKLKPQQAYLMHMTHDVDYQTLSAELPAGVGVAYDGLQWSID